MLYRQVINSHPTSTNEAFSNSCSLTERHLQILWLEQRLILPLFTTNGEPIQVISPGNWNADAGPDFKNAHVRINHLDYRGDVEIHLEEAGWSKHGHHCDKNYNRVILHLFFYRSNTSMIVHKENGQPVFSCDLKAHLNVSPADLSSFIDLDHYPNREFSLRGQCAESLFCILDESEIKQFFQSASYWRLEKKLNHLQKNASNPSMQFACGVAMALGYRHNAKAFLDLFNYLLNFRDMPYQELLAIALGSCGFLEENRKKSWEGSSYYQRLRSLWWGRNDQVEHQTQLKLDRIRPYHHPIRRLAYLAYFLHDINLERFWMQTLHIWQKTIQESKLSFIKLKENLLAILPNYTDDYWDWHYTFESESQKRKLPSLGDDLRMHFLMNTILPLIYGEIRKSADTECWQTFQQFYQSLESPRTSKSHYLHRRFFGSPKHEFLFDKAQMAQGAYQLHQDFCLHYEASCKGCPFVERFKNHFKPLS